MNAISTIPHSFRPCYSFHKSRRDYGGTATSGCSRRVGDTRPIVSESYVQLAGFFLDLTF
jgi:hypothetical protein